MPDDTLIAPPRWRRKRPLRIAAACVALMTIAACKSPPKTAQPKPPPPIDVERVVLRDDIVVIRQFWSHLPWIVGENDRIAGFFATTYFVSGETEKGAFVPGRILAWLYELLRQTDGTSKRQVVHTWELDHDAAMGFRVRKLAVGGYYYGLVLSWPPDIDVSGKLIEIELGYERTDGRVIVAKPRRFRVPLPVGGGYRRPPAANQTAAHPSPRERARTGRQQPRPAAPTTRASAARPG